MRESVELMIDRPARGSWNMAVDQALLERAAAGGSPVLRLYQWEPATLSLGYFQSGRARESHPPSHHLDLVRRASGGGAIVHDRELTYSLVLPQSNRWAADNQNLFARMHATLIRCLEENGVDGCQVFSGAAAEKREGEPFLCFQRRANGDVVLNDFKIAGSAQRRLDKALLQHGSFLVGQSAAAPELPGIRELSGVDLSVDTLIREWPPRLADAFDWEWRAASLEPAVVARAQEIESERFAADSWTWKR